MTTHINQASSVPVSESQFLVVGPGSGKTTVMVLKILNIIYVDDVHPSSILATTFTRKAISELRSRILSWGDEIRQVLLKSSEFEDIHPHLRRLDFNKSLSAPRQHISGHPENTSHSWSSTTRSHTELCNLYLHAKCGSL